MFFRNNLPCTKKCVKHWDEKIKFYRNRIIYKTVEFTAVYIGVIGHYLWRNECSGIDAYQSLLFSSGSYYQIFCSFSAKNTLIAS